MAARPRCGRPGSSRLRLPEPRTASRPSRVTIHAARCCARRAGAARDPADDTHRNRWRASGVVGRDRGPVMRRPGDRRHRRRLDHADHGGEAAWTSGFAIGDICSSVPPASTGDQCHVSLLASLTGVVRRRATDGGDSATVEQGRGPGPTSTSTG